MTTEETRAILTVLKANYPQSFRNVNREVGEQMLALWAEAFKDTPAQLVTSAVKKIIYTDTREFAPNIGQVNAVIAEMTTNAMPFEEAWQIIDTAVHSGSPALEWNKFPAVLKRITSARDIQEWAYSTEPSTYRSVIKGQVRKAYETQIAREKELSILPESIKKLITPQEKRITPRISANSGRDEESISKREIAVKCA